MRLNSKTYKNQPIDEMFTIKKTSETDKVIALAGNPNVGKSSIFNELTGLRQHTGNWPGKTVEHAQGICNFKTNNYIMIDLPGTYSLMAHSKEEEVARDFICFGNPDGIIVVCDATCLERNLNLCLQTLEITDNVVICVNLIDEAKRKKISIDFDTLSKLLGVPVVATSAKNRHGIEQLMKSVENISLNPLKNNAVRVKYPAAMEQAIAQIEEIILRKVDVKNINSRWISLKLLEQNSILTENISTYLNFDLMQDQEIVNILKCANDTLAENGIDYENLENRIVSSLVLTAEGICNEVVRFENTKYNLRDRKIDKFLTSKLTGIPIMLALLALIFWITISGANYPSALLSSAFFWMEEKLIELCISLNIPQIIYEMLFCGVFRVLGWVVSVMLPPMAIFFPLFTLLEDLGYLPRIAFNLDKAFKKCHACGKQALTMCMGFGCNATGIVGCRIIDSPRERLVAMLTNNFVPCNGRFPTLITIITMFFTFSMPTALQSLTGTLILTLIILLGIIMSFAISALLSKTLLKGEASSFTLELPPFRKPSIIKIIIRSIFDRTLFVLGRAITVAAPAGLVIWLLANITVGDMTLLSHISSFLDPFGRLLGMDGVILLAFILGLPANEIVVPIIIMAYMSNGALVEMDNLTELKQILIDNGWTWVTAISTMLFSLMHWPCSTTLMTIKKESGSLKWTTLAFLIPTLSGIVICFLFNVIAQLFI